MSETDGRAILAELFRHNDWANRILLEHCRSLPEETLDFRIEGAYGSVRQTLQHLVAAQAWYASLVTGQELEPPLRSRDPFPGFEALLDRADRSGALLSQAAARLTLDASFREAEDGKEWETRTFVVLIQAINHATEHREQVKATLSQAGLEAPEVSGWRYSWEAGHAREVGAAPA